MKKISVLIWLCNSLLIDYSFAQISLPLNMGVSSAQDTKTVTIDNTSNSNTLTNYQVRLNLTSGNFNFSKSTTTGDDLRFFDSDNATPLSFYTESFNKAGQTAVIWIKVPSIAASSSKTIYLHYGNVSYGLSNGLNTFEFFDDFTGYAGSVSAINATSPIITGTGTAGYLVENPVYDSATSKFWVIMEDRTTATRNITMASASTITGPWTVEASPVISDGSSLASPCIFRKYPFWYIYYGKGSPMEIWVQKSSTVNSGYSTSGISNPIITKGGSGSWKESRCLEPFVFQDGLTLRMLYMGETATTLFERTGMATSTDPISGWVDSPSNPIITNNPPWTWNQGQDQTADPFVFTVGPTYYIGVTGTNVGKGGWSVGFYSTTDWVNFTELPSASANPATAGIGHALSGWDGVYILRGGVFNLNGTYYYFYTGYNGSVHSAGLTTLNISGVTGALILNPTWFKTGTVTLSGGTVSVISGNINNFIKYGQGYAMRSYVKYPATGTTFTGFRVSGTTDLAEFLINSPGNGTIIPVNFLTSQTTGTTLGSPGSYMITEIKRNANTDTRFSINDGTDQVLNTQVPTSNLPPMFNNPIQVDWTFIRKYSNPEPTLSIP